MYRPIAWYVWVCPVTVVWLSNPDKSPYGRLSPSTYSSRNMCSPS